MVEKLTECAKCELDKGIESIDTNEMGAVADIIKDLCEAEYYAKISKAMEEAEYGEDYDYMGAYDRKGYRGQPRDSRGRFTSRRGYEKPIMIHDEHMEDMEHMRDMERPYGRMYYSSGSSRGSYSGASGSDGNTMSYTESRYDRARRGYEQVKEMNKGNSVEEKQHKMKSLEEYAKELTEDVTDMVKDMSAEEKNMLRSKLQTLAQKIS